MAKKRKAVGREGTNRPQKISRQQYDVDETFDDSEDEFRAGNDRILLDENPVTKRLKRIQEQERELEGSDEEVYREDATDSSSDGGAGVGEGPQEEEEEYWGSSKDAYFDADVIETEADALAEEEEAKRLMLKQIKGMSEKDYGFDDLEWRDDKSKTPTIEKLPDIRVTETTSAEEKLRILRTRYPEFDPLVQDFVHLRNRYEQLSTRTTNDDRRASDVEQIQLRSLSTYLATVTVYLAVLTQTVNGFALAPSQLRDHEIMSRLVQARRLWEACKDLQPEKADPIAPAVLVKQQSTVIPPQKPMKDENEGEKERKKQRKSERLLAVVQDESQDEDVPHVENKQLKQINRAGLEDIFSAALTKTADDSESEFGDENPLTSQEAAEKARKKKSLRFYTSQISQKANKRGAASREAGGDDDVPRKERLRDRQERLLREAQQRANTKNDNTELNDNDGDEAMRDIPAGDDYYDMLTSRSKDKKAKKEARATAQTSGQEYLEDEVGDDGKRKISYAIQKNKGLTPRRKKEVRNPRVKKRNMFDKKMKKLAVVRPQYKGGEGRGGYGGEMTGIKTNVVKSIKL